MVITDLHTFSFSTKRGNTNIYRNYFFVRTVHDWNQLDNSTVSVTSVEQRPLESASRATNLHLQFGTR